MIRRGDDWRLLATMIDLQAALLGNQSCPLGEIWLDDSDVIIVPKSPILLTDDFIELVFTRGIYGILPLNATLNFAKINSLKFRGVPNRQCPLGGRRIACWP